MNISTMRVGIWAMALGFFAFFVTFSVAFSSPPAACQNHHDALYGKMTELEEAVELMTLEGDTP